MVDLPTSVVERHLSGSTSSVGRLYSNLASVYINYDFVVLVSRFTCGLALHLATHRLGSMRSPLAGNSYERETKRGMHMSVYQSKQTNPRLFQTPGFMSMSSPPGIGAPPLVTNQDLVANKYRDINLPSLPSKETPSTTLRQTLVKPHALNPAFRSSRTLARFSPGRAGGLVCAPACVHVVRARSRLA